MNKKGFYCTSITHEDFSMKFDADNLSKAKKFTVECTKSCTDFEDVTDKYLHRLTAKCKKHGFIGGEQHGGILNKAFPDKNLATTLLLNRVMCYEDQYNDVARDAFVPLMGNRYFPPWVKKVNSSRLELSCGGPELEVYKYQHTIGNTGDDFGSTPRAEIPRATEYYKKHPSKNPCETHPCCKSDCDKKACGLPHNHNCKCNHCLKGCPGRCEITKTESFPVPRFGGYTPRGTAPNPNDIPKIKKLPDMGHLKPWAVDGQAVCQEGKMNKEQPWLTRSKGWCDVKDFVGIRGKGIQYKATNGGVSNTCCLPPFTNLASVANHVRSTRFPTGWTGGKENLWSYKAYHGGGGLGTKNLDNCFHTLVGETKSCKTTFDLKIEACKTCKCKDESGNLELVKLKITHNLLPAANGKPPPGCIPWFSLADTGIRNMVAVVRTDVMKGVLTKCGKKKNERKIELAREKFSSTNRALLSTIESRDVSKEEARVASGLCQRPRGPCKLLPGKKCPPPEPVPKMPKKSTSNKAHKCPAKMTSVLEWGKKVTCFGKPSYRLPTFVNDLRIGFHAEIFATIVTAGNGLDKDGKPLVLSDEALALMSGSNPSYFTTGRGGHSFSYPHSRARNQISYRILELIRRDHRKDYDRAAGVFAGCAARGQWKRVGFRCEPDSEKANKYTTGYFAKHKIKEAIFQKLNKMNHQKSLRPPGFDIQENHAKIRANEEKFQKWLPGYRKQMGMHPLVNPGFPCSERGLQHCRALRKPLIRADGSCPVPKERGGCNCDPKTTADEVGFDMDVDPRMAAPQIATNYHKVNKMGGLHQPAQILQFDKFWVSAMNSSFTSEFLTYPRDKGASDKFKAYLSRTYVSPVCDQGSWCVDPATMTKIGIRQEGMCAGRNPTYNHNLQGVMDKTPLNMGLDFLIHSPTEFIMRQRMPGSNNFCASRVEWSFCVCKGCQCEKMNMADVKVDHSMIPIKDKDEGMAARCSSWFTYADKAIREYTANVRAAVLSLKTACCIPWTPKNNKQGKCVNGAIAGQLSAGFSGWGWPAYATPGGVQNRHRMYKTSLGPGAPSTIAAEGGGIQYDPIRDCAGIICQNENFPDKMF